MRRLSLIALAALWWLLPLSAGAEEHRTYTTDHPLVYEDAWDLWPYVFLNEAGEPEGFNIDLLKLIFKELDIPYIIKLKPTLEAQKDLHEGRSDLMLRMDSHFTQGDYTFSKSVVQLFTHSVIVPEYENVVIRKTSDLTKYEIIVHDNSFSHNLLKRNGWDKNVIPMRDMKEAVQHIGARGDGIILWNTMSLKWLMRKYQINNFKLVPAEIPFGEYKFVSKDEHLLAQMDSVFTSLRSDNRLQPILNKWFYPDRKESGIPDWIWNLIVALSILSLFVIAYYLFYKYRERVTTRDVRKSNERLSLILRTSHVNFWIYHVTKQTFNWIDEEGRTGHDLTSLEFSQLYFPEDFHKLSEALNRIIEEKAKTVTLAITGKQDINNRSENRYYNVTLSVLRRSKDKRPSAIICSRSDMTREGIRQKKIQENMMRYSAIFENALVDMAYFNENGVLYDINEKACKTFGLSHDDIIARQVTVGDLTRINDLHVEDIDQFYATRIIDVPNAILKDASLFPDGRMYYEIQLIPVRDDEDNLLGIFATGREVTEVVKTYHRRQERITQLQEANNEVTNYIQNIDYVMHVGGIRIVKYNISDHTLTINQDAEKAEYVLTQTRALSLSDNQERKKVLQLFHSLDNKTDSPIRLSIKTAIHIKGGIPLYLHFSVIPTHDEEGNVTGYVGMCRDISELKAVEDQLAKETLHAQEVEVVKNAFLRNMSYEIRTPLSSVVGFSELFEMEHSTEDETIFIQEIKDNSAKLLRLINDILFLSRLDADMITINPQPVDFAKSFDTWCESAWGNIRKPGVNYIVNNPYKRLELNIDASNTVMIINNLIENAVQYTNTGSVMARYDFIGDQLIISIEDTGSGISEKAQKHIFERFVTGANEGAGLGLSICHELIKHMGGSINIKSKKGEGTTVWFSIPCKATEIERT